MANDTTYPQERRPRGDRITLWLLLFATAGVPLFWFAQFLAGSALTGSLCFSDVIPMLGNDPTGWLRWFMLGIDAIAIIAAVVGFVVSLRSWRGARNGMQVKPPLELAIERTRFLAIWGMMTSAGFLLAIVFATIADLAVPLCG